MLGENILENLNPHVSVDCVVFGFEFGKKSEMFSLLFAA